MPTKGEASLELSGLNSKGLTAWSDAAGLWKASRDTPWTSDIVGLSDKGFKTVSLIGVAVSSNAGCAAAGKAGNGAAGAGGGRAAGASAGNGVAAGKAAGAGSLGKPLPDKAANVAGTGPGSTGDSTPNSLIPDNELASPPT